MWSGVGAPSCGGNEVTFIHGNGRMETMVCVSMVVLLVSSPLAANPQPTARETACEVKEIVVAAQPTPTPTPRPFKMCSCRKCEHMTCCATPILAHCLGRCSIRAWIVAPDEACDQSTQDPACCPN